MYATNAPPWGRFGDAMSKKKKAAELKQFVCTDNFKVKANSTGVVIEGFANKATVDRGDEIISTDAWELDNFKKNPVILFNHGFDSLGGTPVGKAVDVRPTEDGLYLKVKMSNSQAPGIKMVRDLVEERILRAFSVGFNSKDSDMVEREGKKVRVIKKAELFEVSIVGIPMNQDSLFELSEKTLANLSFKDVKSLFLKQKHADKAAQVEDMLPADPDARKIFINAAASKSGLAREELLDMLAGNSPLSDIVFESVKEVAKAFDLESVLLEALDQIKEGVDPDEVLASLKEELVDAEIQEGKEDDDTEGGEDEAEKEEGEGDAGKEGDGAGEAAEGGDSSGTEDADKLEKDFQDCVNSWVPKLLEEGMEQDQAVATAIAKCQEEGKCVLADESKPGAYQEIFAQLEEGKKEFTFAKPLKLKQVAEEAQTQQAPTTPVKTEPTPDDFGSPYLDAAKQTNVLLGALINEIQKLSSKLSSDVIESDKDPAKESSAASETGTNAAEKAIKALDQRLKNLGY
jgi:HK97 family phage prohead protease